MWFTVEWNYDDKAMDDGEVLSIMCAWLFNRMTEM